MSIAPTQARLLTITLRKSDTEFQIQIFANRKQLLIQKASQQPNNQLLNSQLLVQEKNIDNEMMNLITIQKALETEFDSVKTLIQKNCEKEFKNFASSS
ncbi:MAG: hypothetical protein V2B14_01610 [bacterium]